MTFTFAAKVEFAAFIRRANRPESSFSLMNYRFFKPNRCIASVVLWLALFPLAAQTPDALADSIPNPDKLSEWDLSVWVFQLTKQAKIFENEAGQKTAAAAAVREAAEQAWKTAKSDSLTAKASLDSLAEMLKTAKSTEKTAQKQQKQASQAVAFAAKVADMDAAAQRKNLRKCHKQIKGVEALLHPPLAEKPIAAVIGSEGVVAAGETPAPSLDSATAVTEPAPNKPKNKDKGKKTEKTSPKYKPYDPAADVMLNPPQRPCALAANTRDEFSGETYRETQREELFRFSNEVMKKHLAPGQPHILCEAALSTGGAIIGLHLTFSIRDANARKAFGSLNKNSVAILKFLDGTTFTVSNLRNDEGTPDASGSLYNYRAQYALDASVLKKLRKNELDKIRVAWSTGYEDYEVQSVDLLMRQAKCLFD